jgi:hypothetical protein
VLLIGNVHSRRTDLLRAALQAAGVPLAVIAWGDLLAEERCCERLSAAVLAGHAWCKLDSPGEDAQVTGALIARGWRLAGAPGPAPHPLRHGELAFQHWWFAGFADLVRALKSPLGSVQLLNAPDEILLMCDKWACQLHLRAHGIPIPELLGEVHSFAELDERLPARSYPALFIKARYGSSAAGVIALRRHPDGRMAAYSSARLDGEGAIYNHLRISRYAERGQIAALVDALAPQGAYAERWIPKPRFPAGLQDGLPMDRAHDACYDLRVVATFGRACQRVARISSSPMTNLHLGNERAQPEWLEDSERAALEATVERAARAFPGSRCIGFDAVLHGEEVHILEANAFGDLLPGLRHPHGPQGSTTYEDQARLVMSDEGR